MSVKPAGNANECDNKATCGVLSTGLAGRWTLWPAL